MGPPLSPRETRRSGRRSAPSASASTSKSPDSDQPPRPKDASRGPSSKAKRKTKDKDKEREKQESNVNSGDQGLACVENQVKDPPEEEEQGVTRCVCGSAGTLCVL